MNTETPANPFAQIFAQLSSLAPFQLPAFTLPFTPPAALRSALHASLTEQSDRMRAMGDEALNVQSQAAAQTRTAIDEGARLMRATLDYQSQLQAAWRNVGLEATQKFLAMMAPPAAP